MPLATLEDASGRVDVVVDCANQVDASPGGGLAYIVGRGQNGPQAGQPSMPRLRALLDGAQQRVVLAEDEGTVRHKRSLCVSESLSTFWLGTLRGACLTSLELVCFCYAAVHAASGWRCARGDLWG